MPVTKHVLFVIILLYVTRVLYYVRIDRYLKTDEVRPTNRGLGWVLQPTLRLKGGGVWNTGFT